MAKITDQQNRGNRYVANLLATFYTNTTCFTANVYFPSYEPLWCAIFGSTSPILDL